MARNGHFRAAWTVHLWQPEMNGRGWLDGIFGSVRCANCGAAYDRTYIEQMVKDHEKDRSDVEKAIKATKNIELKAFEGKELDTIKAHLKLAEEIRAKLK